MEKEVANASGALSAAGFPPALPEFNIRGGSRVTAAGAASPAPFPRVRLDLTSSLGAKSTERRAAAAQRSIPVPQAALGTPDSELSGAGGHAPGPASDAEAEAAVLENLSLASMGTDPAPGVSPDAAEDSASTKLVDVCVQVALFGDSTVGGGASISTVPSRRNPGKWRAKEPLERLVVLCGVLLFAATVGVLLALQGSGGRAAGIQAVRSIVQMPLSDSARSPSGVENTVQLSASNGRRPILYSFQATSGFPPKNTATRVVVSGARDGGASQPLTYILSESVNSGGSLLVSYPQGLVGQVNGTITVTIEAAGTGAETDLVAQGFQV